MTLLLARISDSCFFLKVEIDASCQCGVSADDDRIVNGEEAKVKKTPLDSSTGGSRASNTTTKKSIHFRRNEAPCTLQS